MSSMDNARKDGLTLRHSKNLIVSSLPFYSNHGYSNRSCFNYSKSDRRPQVKLGIMKLWNYGIVE